MRRKSQLKSPSTCSWRWQQKSVCVCAYVSACVCVKTKTLLYACHHVSADLNHVELSYRSYCDIFTLRNSVNVLKYEICCSKPNLKIVLDKWTNDIRFKSANTGKVQRERTCLVFYLFLTKDTNLTIKCWDYQEMLR